MSPFHVLFSTVGPSQDVLEVLLKHFPYQILDAKDANGKQPLDYLVSNWTETTASLLQITIQRWMVDPLVRWGATSWAQVMSNRIQAILAEDNKDQRLTLCNGAYSAFTLYEHLEATSIFEMALWKR
ncbi:unnamed protein product [Cylindrotheca closterium]|uniref:Uncharacterized protein n=1 Tax=Cylindrotheca closterium TaxID=2856 RepID=A0AAD2CU81_9STRA|nr:unnamed protein product [Cylindrotheca closterium]